MLKDLRRHIMMQQGGGQDYAYNVGTLTLNVTIQTRVVAEYTPDGLNTLLFTLTGSDGPAVVGAAEAINRKNTGQRSSYSSILGEKNKLELRSYQFGAYAQIYVNNTKASGIGMIAIRSNSPRPTIIINTNGVKVYHYELRNDNNILLFDLTAIKENGVWGMIDSLSGNFYPFGE